MSVMGEKHMQMIHQQKKFKRVIRLFHPAKCKGPSLKEGSQERVLRGEMQLLIAHKLTLQQQMFSQSSWKVSFLQLRLGLEKRPVQVWRAAREISLDSIVIQAPVENSYEVTPVAKTGLPQAQDSWLPSPNLLGNSNLSVHPRHSQPMSETRILKQRQLQYQKGSPMRRQGILPKADLLCRAQEQLVYMRGG